MNFYKSDLLQKIADGRFTRWRTGNRNWIGKFPYDILDAAAIAGSPAMPGIIEGGHFTIYEPGFSYRDIEGGLQQWHANTQRLAAQWRSQHGADIVAELPGTWCFLAQPWSDVFWHWMCEALVKISAFESSGYKGGFIVPGGVAFVRRSLDLLQIQPERIYYCDAPYAKIERLIIPHRFRAQLDLKSQIDTVDWLRERLLSDQKMDHDLKIYAARRGRRSIVNEDDLLSLLSKHGFQSVYMEDLDLGEQIALVSRAAAFTGPHGSGFAHTMFMPRRSHVVELFAPSGVNPCMLTTVEHLEQDYSMIVGTTSLASGTTHDAPILANIELVSLTLKRAEELDRFHRQCAQS
ncbi:capsular polysaccharide biosynthesis protein [Methylobacterium sp. OAE515]|uniref:glycosyltransferase family 61 protein n=1 Tax=Methylobacterium sp. OAE515 TaxID=2817895 RepID=UPI00178B7142